MDPIEIDRNRSHCPRNFGCVFEGGRNYSDRNKFITDAQIRVLTLPISCNVARTFATLLRINSCLATTRLFYSLGQA